MDKTPPVILIAGCGYLGQEVARLCAGRGWRAIGLTRSFESAREASTSAGLETHVADLGEADDLRALREALPPVDAVLHAASSSRGGPEAYRRVFIDGIANLVEVFRPARLLFTSSTSVYAQTDGSEVDESSPAKGGSETSRLLLEAERLTLLAGGTVARLAGLYGPGRCVVLRKFFDGTAVLEDGGHRILNQIHRADAGEALMHLLDWPGAAGGIFNVADDAPVEQRAVFAWLAERFGRSLPPAGPKPEGRKRGWTCKRVCNAKLRTSGWHPRYPAFFDAVAGDPGILDGLALGAG